MAGDGGYVVYRFRGRYYVIFNRYGSDPDGLGYKATSSIPENPEEYQTWLKKQHAKLRKWEEILLTKVLPIPEDTINMLSLGSKNREFLEARYSVYLDEKLEATPAFVLPRNDYPWILWVYTIDLDNNLFIVDNGAHFGLAQVHRAAISEDGSWIDALTKDRNNRRLILPLVQKQSIPRRPLHAQECSSRGEEAEGFAVVQPKGLDDFPQNFRAAPIFYSTLWDNYRRELENALPYTPIQLKPQDFAFREISFSILSLAAGLTGNVALIDRSRGNDPLGPSDVAARVAHGYHKDGVKPGSAPDGTIYWFKNVLVYLAEDLTTQRDRRNATTRALCYGLSTVHAKESFNAVLLSIRHAILLRYSSSGVQVTDPLPLLSVNGDDDSDFSAHCVKDMKEKSYGDPRDSDDEDANDGKALANHAATTQDDAAIKSSKHDASFFALMHLFEASVRAELKPEQAGEGTFPTEIYREILKSVDCGTQGACLQVSRKFKTICQEQMFVTEHLMLKAHDAYQCNFKFWNTSSEELVEAAFSLDDSKRLDRDKVENFVITYGYDIRYPGALRLSWTCFCNLGDIRDEISWPKGIMDQTQEYDGIDERNMSESSADHFWLDDDIIPKYRSFWTHRRLLNYNGTFPVDAIYSMWLAICRKYKLQTWPTDYSVVNMEPHTRTANGEVRKAWRREKGEAKGGHLLDWIRADMFLLEVGRPNTLYDLDQTFLRLFKRGEKKARKEIAAELEGQYKRRWLDLFVIVAVGYSVEFYQFNSETRNLLPFGNAKRLEIFREGDREVVEDFLNHVKKCATLALKDCEKPEGEGWVEYERDC